MNRGAEREPLHEKDTGRDREDGSGEARCIRTKSNLSESARMNFSVHLNDELVERLDQTAKESGKARNALIREAVAEWLGRRQAGNWPAEILLGSRLGGSGV